jgi:peptide/nickel transport system permease protein
MSLVKRPARKQPARNASKAPFLAGLQNSLRELRRYPSAIFGSAVILLLVGIAVYALATIPYNTAITLWRGGEDVWYQNPKFAPPAWLNFFNSKKLPVSFAVDSGENGKMLKTTTTGSNGISTEEITYSFDYTYDEGPQEIILYLKAQFDQKLPFVSVKFTTPDGREISIFNSAVEHQETFRFSQDVKLQRNLHTTVDKVMGALFAPPGDETLTPVKGTYVLHIVGTTFEEGSNIDAQFVLHGRLFGWAGTDQYRRDLMLPLLWGTPVALAFGLFAALGTSVVTMIVAAIGVWYGGWVDALIQRVTEVNLVLPFLAILILVGTLYSRSIWVILGVTVLLSIFTGNIKAYRAIFLQSKVAGYIEAAQAYGASNSRIIFSYLIPRMIPILIPGLVISIPSYVFLEASLAVLGLGDPVLPTWGKIIENAYVNGALYRGFYYWVLEPAVLLMLTGFGFAMLGFALDRIFNPRLRDI